MHYPDPPAAPVIHAAHCECRACARAERASLAADRRALLGGIGLAAIAALLLTLLPGAGV